MQAEIQSKALKRAIRRVTEYIAAQTKPVTGKQIADNVIGRTQDIYEALDWLRSIGRLKASGDGVKGDPIRYQLADLEIPEARRTETVDMKQSHDEDRCELEFEEFVV